MSKNVENRKFQPLRSPYKYGHIQKRRVRCGRSNCKCSKGFYHTAYYHVWDDGGVRHRKYIRRSSVESLRELCKSNRALKNELRTLNAVQKEFHEHFRWVRRLFGRWNET